MSNDSPRMRPWITDDDKAAVMAVLDRGDLMSGREVHAFEEELAAYFGKRHAVCVSSGTAALECAFVATGEGDKISPDGFVAILSAARGAGKRPDANEYGVQTVLLQNIRGGEVYCRVLDCAHAFDEPTRYVADVQCYSMAPNKVIACGGGCLVTNDSRVAAHARQYRNHGRDGGPEVFGPGRNLRMGEMSAALGRSQLRRISDIIGKRREVAAMYESATGASARGTFLFPYFTNTTPHNKLRCLSDFKLFGSAGWRDKATVLLEIWPLMTKEDVQAQTNKCGVL